MSEGCREETSTFWQTIWQKSSSTSGDDVDGVEYEQTAEGDDEGGSTNLSQCDSQTNPASPSEQTDASNTPNNDDGQGNTSADGADDDSLRNAPGGEGFCARTSGSIIRQEDNNDDSDTNQEEMMEDDSTPKASIQEVEKKMMGLLQAHSVGPIT